MMNRMLEFLTKRPRVFWRDTRHKDAPLVLQKFGSNFEDLFRRLARSENDFRKAFAQRPMHVHLGESEVSQRRRLKRLQHFVAADFPGPKFVQQPDGFRCGHVRKVPEQGQISISNSLSQH